VLTQLICQLYALLSKLTRTNLPLNRRPRRLAPDVCDNVLYNTLMVRKKPPRKKPSSDVETAVLDKSARRCTLCFREKGDLKVKLGQIAHLDDDPSNSVEDNLAWMCLDHHSLYDSKTKQHKNYTIQEVKAARSKLYKMVAEGKHLTPADVVPSLQAEADKRTLADFLAIVPSMGTIHFLRTEDFAGSYREDRLDSIHRYVAERGGPDHEFLDSELEAIRRKFRQNCESFLHVLGKTAEMVGSSGIMYRGVPAEWKHEAPEDFKQAVNEIHSTADAVCSTYDDLVRSARKKLAF
jgi:hypothetical protein